MMREPSLKRAVYALTALVAVVGVVRAANAQFTAPTCVPPNCNPSVIQNIDVAASSQSASINVSGNTKFGGTLQTGTAAPVLNLSTQNLMYGLVSNSSTAGSIMLLEKGVGVPMFRVGLNGDTTIQGPLSVPAGTAAAPSITFNGDANTGFYNVGADSIGFTTGGTQRTIINNNGTQVASGQLFVPSGTAALPGITFSGDTNTGIWRSANEQINFTTNGVNRMTMTATGTVVIPGSMAIYGTFTGANYAGDGSALTNINASNITSGTVADARLSANVALLNANQTFSGLNTFSNGLNAFTGNGSGLSNLNASNLSAGTVPSARISGTYSNNLVLSGMTTLGSTSLNLAPGQNVLYGVAALASTGGNLLLLERGSGGTRFSVDLDGNVFANGGGTYTGDVTVGGQSVCREDGTNCPATVTGTGTTNFVLKFTPSGSAVGNSQIFDDGTNVGINATPFYKLDVGGDVRFSGNLGAGGNIPAVGIGANIGDMSHTVGVQGVGSNYGVQGSSNNFGVIGQGSNVGVYGQATVTPGGLGVSGYSSVTNGKGVQGFANGPGGYGVEAIIAGSSLIGFYTSNTLANAFGVYAYSNGSNGTGVYGEGVTGVLGISGSANAVYGYVTGGTSAAVRGESAVAGAYGGNFTTLAGGTALRAAGGATGLNVTGTTNSISASGNITMTSGQFVATLNGVGTPPYTFTGDTDTGIYRSAADTLAFATAGVQRATMSAAYPIDVIGTARATRVLAGNATPDPNVSIVSAAPSVAGGVGVHGYANVAGTSAGVMGTGTVADVDGVYGTSSAPSASGVYGYSSGGGVAGVFGVSADGTGVRGVGPTYGVYSFGNFAATGNTTLGDAGTDTLTITGTNVSIPNNLNIDTNMLYVDAVNDFIGVRTAVPSVPIHVDGSSIAGGEGLPALTNRTSLLVQSNNGSDPAIATLISGRIGVARLNFGDADNDDQGYIAYNNNVDFLSLASDGLESVRLDNSATTGWFQFVDGGSTRGYVGYGDANGLFVSASTDSMSLRGETELNLGTGTERDMRIDASGNTYFSGFVGAGGSPVWSNYGLSAQGSTIGVYGWGGSYGLYGSGSSYGVYAGGGTYGVYGSGSTYGVYGSGSSYGLYGYSGSLPLQAYGGNDLNGSGTGGVAKFMQTSGKYILIDENEIEAYDAAGVPLILHIQWDGGDVAFGSSTQVGLGTSSPSYQLQLSTNSAAKPTSTAWTVPSDRRLKENIKDFTDGLGKLKQLRPVSYQLNGKGGMPKGEDGISIIAQEALPVIPYAINHFQAKLNPEDIQETDLLDFDSGPLTFILVNAAKELDLKIDGLDAVVGKQGKDIDSIEERVEELERRIEELESR